MIGYALILIPPAIVAYWFLSLHSTIGDFGAIWTGLTAAVALILWRMRR